MIRITHAVDGLANPSIVHDVYYILDGVLRNGCTPVVKGNIFCLEYSVSVAV